MGGRRKDFEMILPIIAFVVLLAILFFLMKWAYREGYKDGVIDAEEEETPESVI